MALKSDNLISEKFCFSFKKSLLGQTGASGNVKWILHIVNREHKPYQTSLRNPEEACPEKLVPASRSAEGPAMTLAAASSCLRGFHHAGWFQRFS